MVRPVFKLELEVGESIRRGIGHVPHNSNEIRATSANIRLTDDMQFIATSLVCEGGVC